MLVRNLRMAAIQKVLITGGAGFIGSHLAAAWSRAGADVTVLDSLRTGRRENLAGIKCRLVEAHIEDRALLMECARGVDCIHHLAAIVSVPESMERPVETETVNVIGTVNVLDAARSAGVGRVVFSSTCAVYGDVERPSHTESDAPDPASPYAISKLAGEKYMHLYSRAFGVPTVSLRYFNVYGPRQDPASPYAAAVAIFSECARRNAPLRIFGDGEQTRDFVHVEDVVAANLLAAERGSGVYNVGAGSRTTINDLAREIIRLSGSRSSIEHAPPRAGDVRHSRGNVERIKGLGWEPRVTLAEGLGRLLAAYS